MASYSKMVYEKKVIKWPSRTNEDGSVRHFTKQDVLDMNKGEISHVSVQAKINALIQLGAIEIVKKEKTNGRPRVIYKFVGYFQPVPPTQTLPPTE